MADELEPPPLAPPSLLDKAIRFSLERKLVIVLALVASVFAGVFYAPFDWEVGGLERDPVPVDAIPDIGENQQIVFTEWMGRSPQDVEDQISYPMTVALLGVPGVKTVRSYSMLGFSSIYVIFKDGVDFYWSRSRVLEKLSSLPAGTLPEGVQPTLGPDATALGQIFWYTLEGRDEKGNPAGGWDLDELRSVQDWQVRYALLAADGVSEVASVGGFVKEYQIDVDPDAMRAYGVSLDQIFTAVKMSNVDVGARTIEINKVEYVIRGIGFIKSVKDVEDSVVAVNDNVPVYVRNVAHVSLGPALRRGALDKEGVEAVGGVVVVRYGENPLAAIKNVKKKIAEIANGLPRRTLPDGRVSQITVVPFYDRSGLIYETLGTLNNALSEEMLVTIIVVLVMVMHLRSSVLISLLLPIAVLMCFAAMKIFHVDANIVALSGIAIAIGTMVDMGIVICENILRHLEEAPPEESRLEVVFRASKEVGGAVLTAVATTIVGFLPVFTMTAAEGKLFKPLAYTKTFALIASVMVALFMIPPFAQMLFTGRIRRRTLRMVAHGLVVLAGIVTAIFVVWWAGVLVMGIGAYHFAKQWIPERVQRHVPLASTGVAVFVVLVLLAKHWTPLGPEKGLVRNLVFAGLMIGGLLSFFRLFQMNYGRMLRWFLTYKPVFLVAPVLLVGAGWLIWNGLGKEFMPPLDEGSFLYMPTTMPHASIGEALDVLQKQDMGIRAIPEVELVVGKIGRAETPLDPAPVSMVETVINYKSEFVVDKGGTRLTYRFDPEGRDLFRDFGGKPVAAPDGDHYYVAGQFVRDESGQPIPEDGGMPFRLWRPALVPALNEGRQAWPGIREPDDIWDEILDAAQLPGTTSAPRLQPIAARIVMLQSGMRAPMGVKVKGPSLETIDRVGLQIERLLKEVPSVRKSSVIADRIVGKPYLEIEIDRGAIARYGIHLRKVQDVIEVAIGGRRITTTVEGRERYPVRVRYLRELRDRIETLDRILVSGAGGVQIPLKQLARINYVRGPQVIKSEDTFLIGYVLFDMEPGNAEVDVVEEAKAYLEGQEEVYRSAHAEASRAAAGESRELTEAELAALPGLRRPEGVSYKFAGSYENQIRSEKTLMIVLPLALFIIFVILYLQFSSVVTTLLVFSGIVVAWAGGFVMLWLYAQPWFLDFSVFGVNMRDLFGVHPVNLSVAVWVGFLALFGIASDDGVVMATYLGQSFAKRRPDTVEAVREATVAAGIRRIRPCLMTTATTIIALIPVLTSRGRGADVMVPMAIPVFGGMVFEVITLFVVPVLYCAVKEFRVGRREK